jgi:hypothetical protein
MRIAVPHHTTKEEARKIVDRRLGDLLAQYGHYATEAKTEWNGDRFDFSGKARGFSASGFVEITDTEVIIDGKLPLIAKPFEPRIKSTVEREAEQMFRKTT